MQELNIDLNNKNKSKTKRIFGILIITFTIIWLIVKYNQNELSLFNNTYGILLFIWGIDLLYNSIGKNIFGKSYIKMTEDKLDIKQKVFGERVILYWENVKNVKIGVVKIDITDIEEKLHSIDLSTLDYPIVMRLKENINEKANKLELQKV